MYAARAGMGTGVAEGGTDVTAGMGVLAGIMTTVGLAGESAEVLHDVMTSEKTQNAKQRGDNLV
jgi:hypothetical protein